MSYVPQGGNWKNIPDNNYGPATQSNLYYRLNPKKPCICLPNWRKTVITHPTEDRILSVAEAAALQGLPKTFHFLGSLSERQQQVGNGVPYAIASAIKEAVSGAFLDLPLPEAL